MRDGVGCSSWRGTSAAMAAAMVMTPTIAPLSVARSGPDRLEPVLPPTVKQMALVRLASPSAGHGSPFPERRTSTAAASRPQATTMSTTVRGVDTPDLSQRVPMVYTMRLRAAPPGTMPGVSIEPDTKDWTWVLERPCPECGYDGSKVRPEQLADLTHENTRGWHGVLDHHDSAVRPAPHRWSRLEYACHVRDVHEVFANRVHLMLDEDDPEFEN